MLHNCWTKCVKIKKECKEKKEKKSKATNLQHFHHSHCGFDPLLVNTMQRINEKFCQKWSNGTLA